MPLVFLSSYLFKTKEMSIKDIVEKLRLLIDPYSQLTTIANLASIMDMGKGGSKIIISIANIEEDPILKNASIYEREANSNGYRNIYHPKKHLIVSLLFSSPGAEDSEYLEGLRKLQSIIQFFQDNRLLYYSKDEINDPLLYLNEFELKTESEKENYLPLQIDAVSLNYDQMNQLWSYIGTKYMPSVLYKLRFLPVAVSQPGAAGIIEKIKIDQYRRNDDPEEDPPLSSIEFTKEN